MAGRVRSFRLALVLLLCVAGTAAPAAAVESTSLVAAGDVPMTAGVATALETLPSITPYSLFIHFGDGRLEDHKALVEGHGLTVTSEFPSVNVVYAWGTVGEIRGLTREPSVVYLEENRQITFFQETTVWATRARAAHEEVSGGPYFDQGGAVVDGAGVGVAILDTGIDGTHPDLSGRIARNFEVICTTPFLINTTTEQCFGPVVFVDADGAGNTDDNASGHGTHVAGIALGDGTASTGTYGGVEPAVPGTFSGVAPAASLYGFGIASGGQFLTVAESFQWILDNNDEIDPPIGVINNSWGTGPIAGEPELPHDPNSIESKLVNALVQQGVAVVFAAGNRGGDGATDRTTPECKNPTPGVICVANYNDAGTGSRNSVLSASSSRGRNGAPTTAPDISAPGTSAQRLSPVLIANAVASACRPGTHMIDCAVASQDWPGFYSALAGTSMAAPHVAGAVALLRQAVPTLTPAQIEDVILDTAHRFTAGAAYVSDPQNNGGTTSFDKGAGLLDVKAALDALGVPHAGVVTTPEPQVTINEPLEGTTFDGSGPIPVGGTANDGTTPTLPPATVVLTDGDSGDFSGQGSADIESLSVTETPAGTTPGGFTYSVGLRDANDFSSGLGVTLQLFQNVNGVNFGTRITTTAEQVTAQPAGGVTTAPATSASRSGANVDFFIPYANLGDPPAGAPIHNVAVSSLIGSIVDVAPGSSSTALADFNARPQYARPYTAVRPQEVAPPVAAVTLSVDGGAPQPATIVGASPAYTWSTDIDPSGLSDGSHTLTATVLLNGIPAATDTSSFVIERPVLHTYQVTVTDPAPGTTVARGTVRVAGTSLTDDPSTDQVVTVGLVGPEPMAETPAVGTATWAVDVNFERQAGDYTIVARFSVGGTLRATVEVGIVVPPEIDTEISCAPRTLKFWRQQFGSSQSPNGFTAAERGVLLDRAVLLSDGAFGTGEELREALLFSGKPDPRPVAARQFAALLLNLAAGDVSATLSIQLGVSGSEGLDPAMYDTAVVGSTVDAATAWIRSQMSDGNLGGAAEVASAINNGHGLVC